MGSVSLLHMVNNSTIVWKPWLLVAGMVFSMTLAQLFFKMAGLFSLEYSDLVNSWLFNPWVFASFAATTIAMFFWLFALKRLPLSSAYPWTAVVYVLTPLASMYLFDDHLSLSFFIGMSMILFGVIFTTTGTSGLDDIS